MLSLLSAGLKFWRNFCKKYHDNKCVIVTVGSDSYVKNDKTVTELDRSICRSVLGTEALII